MEEKRILAIDYGNKRIGLAITDPLMMFAIPYSTIPHNSKSIQEIVELVKEKSVKEIILGNPVKESGEDSELSNEIKKFKNKIENNSGIKVTLVDERYTSEMAYKRIVETVPSKKKRREKALIDKNAAAIMLEEYLEAKNQ